MITLQELYKQCEERAKKEQLDLMTLYAQARGVSRDIAKKEVHGLHYGIGLKTYVRKAK